MADKPKQALEFLEWRRRVDKFRKVSEVIPSNPVTYGTAHFLTIDADWAHDEVLEYTLDLLLSKRVVSTWFITHQSFFLEQLRAARQDNMVEIGINPNFNLLLDGKGSGSSAKDVVSQLLEIVPEATAVKSHSLAVSSRILEIFGDFGLTHDINAFLPANARVPPWVDYAGLTRIPLVWDDYIYAMGKLPHPTLDFPGSAFAFHPIHIFLNTESLNRYERTRVLHNRPDELKEQRYSGCGARALLEALLG